MPILGAIARGAAAVGRGAVQAVGAAGRAVAAGAANGFPVINAGLNIANQVVNLAQAGQAGNVQQPTVGQNGIPAGVGNAGNAASITQQTAPSQNQLNAGGSAQIMEMFSQLLQSLMSVIGGAGR